MTANTEASVAALSQAATFTLEAAPLAPFAAAAVAATTVWIEAGKSLVVAYVNHFAALALVNPDASATQIMSDFTRDVPDSKTKGTPAVTKSQIGRVLKDSATLADVRRDYTGADFSMMTPEEFGECVAGAAATLKAAMNAVKHAASPKVEPVGVTGAAQHTPLASDPAPAPDDALTLCQDVMTAIAALRAMVEAGDDDASIALSMIAAEFAPVVEAEERIAA